MLQEFLLGFIIKRARIGRDIFFQALQRCRISIDEFEYLSLASSILQGFQGECSSTGEHARMKDC